MKIIILGSGGMAGHIVTKHLQKDHEVIAFARKKWHKDIVPNDLFEDIKEIDWMVNNEFHPDVIINCTGILVQKSNTNVSDAIYINSYLPHYLEEITADTNTKVIHLSTDCVFAGDYVAYHTEISKRDGNGWYAKTKIMGELDNVKDLTIRTSIIGPELKNDGTGLFHWFMTNKDKKVKGYVNHIWSGVTTLELAHQIKYIIEEKKDLNSIYHLTSQEPITKYNLLDLCRQVFNKDIIIEPIRCRDEINRTLIDTRNVLPKLSINYLDMLRDLKDWMDANRGLYQQYY